MLSDFVNRFGITFHARLSICCKYLNTVCSHPWTRGHARTAMSTETANAVVCAVSSARLDYCNRSTACQKIILKSCSELKEINSLVLSSNYVGVATSCSSRRHWLPIRDRMTFKVSTPAYKFRPATNVLARTLRSSLKTFQTERSGAMTAAERIRSSLLSFIVILNSFPDCTMFGASGQFLWGVTCAL